VVKTISIAKTLAELHVRTLSVTSKLEKGSVFECTPLLRLAVEKPPDPPVSPGKRILVVDDDPDILEFLADRLASYGYLVEMVTDGRNALKAFRQRSFHGLILDIGIPEIDGLGVLQQIRDSYSTIPVVIVTASGSKERAIQAIGMGAQAYLLKPFDAACFKDVVERWFGQTHK
jgi:DNA-binding NtrC family response regulator